MTKRPTVTPEALLRQIDSILARRPALDDKPTRIEKIMYAIKTAAERDRLAKVNEELVEALEDMFSGWRYIRQQYGDLEGVGWDRAENKTCIALAAAHKLQPEEDVRS